jgi:hypothetical protein
VRLRALRTDLIDPTIAVHHGCVVERIGDGVLVEFRSVVDAVRCAIEVQNAIVEPNVGTPDDQRIVFRIGNTEHSAMEAMLCYLNLATRRAENPTLRDCLQMYLLGRTETFEDIVPGAARGPVAALGSLGESRRPGHPIEPGNELDARRNDSESIREYARTPARTR